MGNGLCFNAGRDMPPGMQEKMALKIAAGFQTIPGDTNTATAMTDQTRKLFDDLRERREGDAGNEVTAASAIVKIQEEAELFKNKMQLYLLGPVVCEVIYKHIMEKSAERGERPKAIFAGPDLVQVLLEEEVHRVADGRYLWRNIPIIKTGMRRDFYIAWDVEEFKMPTL